MFKKFTFEDDNDRKLAIDRLLDNSEEKEAGALHLTSKILSQRDEIVKEIVEEEKTRKEEAKESEDSDSGDDDWGGEESSEEGDDKEGSELDADSDVDDADTEWDDDDDDDDFDVDKEDSDKKSDKKKEEKKDDKKDSDKKDDKKDKEESEVSTESSVTKLHGLVTPNIRLKKGWNFFKSLRKMEKERLSALATFGITLEDDSENNNIEVGTGDVVYSKEAVIEALSRLSSIYKKYKDNTLSFISTMGDSLTKLNERLMNFKKVVERGDIDYTDKLISDVNILKLVAYQKDIDLRESLRLITKFVIDANDVVKLLPNNQFDKMLDVFGSRRFLPTHDVAEYYKVLPGFNKVAVQIPEYNNYFKTSPLEYQFYILNQHNPSEIYELNPVSITEEKDVDYIIDGLLNLITQLSISVDLLTLVVKNFDKHLDAIKIMKVNVENDEYDKLNEIGIDDNLKEFIIFKLIVEVMTVSTNISLESMTGFMSILEESTILKGVEDKSEDKLEEDSKSEEGEGESSLDDW